MAGRRRTVQRRRLRGSVRRKSSSVGRRLWSGQRRSGRRRSGQTPGRSRCWSQRKRVLRPRRRGLAARRSGLWRGPARPRWRTGPRWRRGLGRASLQPRPASPAWLSLHPPPWLPSRPCRSGSHRLSGWACPRSCGSGRPRTEGRTIGRPGSLMATSAGGLRLLGLRRLPWCPSGKGRRCPAEPPWRAGPRPSCSFCCRACMRCGQPAGAGSERRLS